MKPFIVCSYRIRPDQRAALVRIARLRRERVADTVRRALDEAIAREAKRATGMKS